MDAITGRPARRPVRAAGGLVARDGEILLVHRPRFDDWSLPKGKLKRGEHPLAAAVREVHEETAVWGVPGIRLPSVGYQVWSGQSLVDKTVDWWAMSAAQDAGSLAHPDAFTPTEEVDELAWVPVAMALEILTYERDRLVVTAYADLPSLARPVVLLRHASVDRSPSWSSSEADRPLSRQGEAQASALAHLLRLLRPGRLVTAPPLRCRQTVAELARTLDLGVDVDPRFDDDADPGIAAAALRSISGDVTTVVCSPGRLIPAAAARLAGRSAAEHAVPMGAALVLSLSGGRLVAADALTSNVS